MMTLRKRVAALETRMEVIETEAERSISASVMRAGMRKEATALRADLDRIGAEVQKLLLIPGLQEVSEVPAKTIPAVPAHYELKKAGK